MRWPIRWRRPGPGPAPGWWCAWVLPPRNEVVDLERGQERPGIARRGEGDQPPRPIGRELKGEALHLVRRWQQVGLPLAQGYLIARELWAEIGRAHV